MNDLHSERPVGTAVCNGLRMSTKRTKADESTTLNDDERAGTLGLIGEDEHNRQEICWRGGFGTGETTPG
jgi:hypothetical protein